MDDGRIINVNSKAEQLLARVRGINSVIVQNVGVQGSNGARLGGAVRVGSHKVTKDSGIRLPHRATMIFSGDDVPEDLWVVSEDGAETAVSVVTT